MFETVCSQKFARTIIESFKKETNKIINRKALYYSCCYYTTIA